MLAESPMHAALPVADLQRAKSFYADKLGLTPEIEGPGGLFYRCGENTMFLLFPSQGTASGTHTQAGWRVDDIETEVANLKARGVVFEEYDMPSFKTINSIASMGTTRSAWFRDSESNLLVLLQLV